MSSAAVLDAAETETSFVSTIPDFAGKTFGDTNGRVRPGRPVHLARPTREHQRAESFFVPAEGNLSLGYRTIKRTLDIVGAAAVLVMLLPVMLATLFVLTITTKGRPLFSQDRVGYQGRIFRIWKFRTMRLDADAVQHTVANEAEGPVFKNRRDPRITWLGRYLRKFSIDETPQLFSVLVGDMSLVGPRPLRVSEVAAFAPSQRRRLAVMPGLTCLWQVSGRSNIGFEEWLKMDVWYVENQNLWTDLSLLVRTPLTVITGKGAY
jgi:lipopolysaccharide/colanic/teichoic acid biosynthesis glycosyltransferase